MGGTRLTHKTSAVFTNSYNASRASGLIKSKAIERLFRLMAEKYNDIVGDFHLVISARDFHVRVSSYLIPISHRYCLVVESVLLLSLVVRPL